MLRHKLLVWCVGLLLMPTLVGCGTNYSVLREDKRLARFDVESDPSNLNIYVNSEPHGKTPATVEVPYIEREKKVEPGGKKTGLWLMILGGIGTALGGILTVVGVRGMSNSATSSSDWATGYISAISGGTIGLSCLLILIGGIYLFATTKTPPNIFEVEPSKIEVGLNIPGEGMQGVKLTPINSSISPKFDQLKQIHYSMSRGTWDAPVLPPNLQLVGSGIEKGPIAPMPVSRRFSTSEGKDSTVIVAVFDIEDSGAKISSEVIGRLSAYLAMSLAATGKFQVVPRDMIKQSLKEQKRESYKECYDQSCQIEVGKEVAAQKSLSTTIAKLGSKCTITSVLYDLRRSASEGGASATGRCDEDGIVTSLESVVAQLAR